MYCLSMSRNNDMNTKLQYRRKFFKTTLSSLWNTNFLKTDVYNQFLNRMTGNTKIVQGANNYDLSSNMINGNFIHTDFGVSYFIQTFVNKISIKLWNDYRVILLPPEFQICRKNILYFMKRVKICCSIKSRGVYALNQGHMT